MSLKEKSWSDFCSTGDPLKYLDFAECRRSELNPDENSDCTRDSN